MLSLVRSLGPLPGFFFLGPRVVPSLAVWCWQSSGKQNKEKAIVPVSSVKQRKAMKREQAIVHEALSSCFFLGNRCDLYNVLVGKVPRKSDSKESSESNTYS